MAPTQKRKPKNKKLHYNKNWTNLNADWVLKSGEKHQIVHKADKTNKNPGSSFTVDWTSTLVGSGQIGRGNQRVAPLHFESSFSACPVGLSQWDMWEDASYKICYRETSTGQQWRAASIRLLTSVQTAKKWSTSCTSTTVEVLPTNRPSRFPRQGRFLTLT